MVLVLEKLIKTSITGKVSEIQNFLLVISVTYVDECKT